MENPGLPPALWAILDGRLWHATGPSELAGIIADGEIKVFKNRYNNSLSKAHDAVSLMDFGPSATDKNQFCNWVGWMGYQQKSRFAVWLEIDRRRVSGKLYDAGAALALWRDTRPPLNFIPGVEACHRGPIPIAAILSVLLIDQYYDNAQFLHCSMNSDLIEGQLANFEQGLPVQPESGFGDALEAAFENDMKRHNSTPSGRNTPEASRAGRARLASKLVS